MLCYILILITAFLGSILAGLFGGGGGLIFTPAIFLFLTYKNPHASYIMQTSITTMITSMLLSGLVAAIKQHRYNQVDWKTLHWSAPLIIVGAICGCFVMMVLPSKLLTYFFASATLILAAKSAHKLYNKPLIEVSTPPTSWYFRYIGSFFLGIICTISGSASFVVQFYERIGLNIKKAIGTTTVSVWLYSIFVVLIMIISGLSQCDLPSGNVGYLNYQYLLLFMSPTIPGALVGAKLSNYLPERNLKIVFTFLLIVIGIGMMYS